MIILRFLRLLRHIIFRVNELHTCTPRVYIVSTMLVIVWLYFGYCLVIVWLWFGCTNRLIYSEEKGIYSEVICISSEETGITSEETAISSE